MQCQRTCDTTDMMYLYFGKANLVCLLVLLATFSLPARAQIPQPGDTSPKRPGGVGPGVSKNSSKNSSTEPPTVTTTPQATSMEGEGDNESTATTVAVSPSEGLNEDGSSNGEGAAAKKEDMEEEFLYFQVTKCISRRNLTLGDIEDVLRQKNDDGRQFSFMLADKLGYIVDDKHDDPHIPMIRSHRKKLVALLEAKKKSLMASSQQPVPTVSDVPSQVTSEPASDNINEVPVGSDVSKGGSSNGEGAAAKKEEREEFLYFQITKCISRRNLTLGDIEDVLRQKNDDGSQFSFTLADKLGYIVDDNYDDPHMPVMKSHREKLVALLESMMPSSQHKHEPVPTVPVYVSDVPTTEPTKTKTPSEGVAFSDKQNSQMTKLLESEAGTNSGSDGDGGAGGKQGGDRHPGDGEPSAPSPSPPAQRTPPSREDVEDSGSKDDNEESRLPGDLTDDGQGYNVNGDGDGNGDGDIHVGLDEEQPMELVQSEGFQNYLETEYNELYGQFLVDKADPDKLGAVLEEYIEWKSGWSEIAVNEKGGGGSDGNYKKIKPEPKQGENVWIVHVPRP